jgi:DNA-binding response OmpR family regulator
MEIIQNCSTYHELSQAQFFASESILVVTNPSLAEQAELFNHLKEIGYNVYNAESFREGLQIALLHLPKIIFLDWKEACELSLAFIMAIKNNPLTQHIQVVFLGTTFTNSVISDYLSVGVDDYIVKPYQNYTIDVRIKYALQRNAITQISNVQDHIFSEKKLLKINAIQRLVVLHMGKERQTIEICPIGFKLLYFLAQNPNNPFTRSDLISQIWGTLDAIDDRSIDVYIARLRNALASKKIARLIRTVRGIGYSFDSSIVNYEIT